MQFQDSKFFKNLTLFLAVMGPGIITASVGNNSAGIATYSLAGAHFGYALLWSFVPMTLALIVAQEMGARMAVATGKGLADLIRENFGVKITFYLMALLFVTNLICVMAEFSGVAASMEIFGIHKGVSIPLAGFAVWLLIVKGTYKMVERVFLLLSFFYIAYIVSGFMAKPDWMHAVHDTIVPDFHLNAQSSIMLIGMIGTTITPWMMFYLQASIVEKRVEASEFRQVRLDSIIGCVIAVVVAFFIVVACAATLHQAQIPVHSVKDAAIALQPLAGPHAATLFALGVFNAALFAVCIMPLSTAYTICEGLGWEEGIDKRFAEAPQFFGLFTAMIVIGAGTVLLPNFPLLKIMYLSQVGNGVILPVILYFMMRLVNDAEIMGEFTNTRAFNFIGGATIVLVSFLSIMMVVLSLIQG